MGLLLMMFGVSYYTARWVIWEDDDMHRDRAVAFYVRGAEELRTDLMRFAANMRDDQRFQEYVFAVVRIGAQGRPLERLVSELFQGFSYDQLVVLDDEGRTLLGKEHQRLASSARQMRSVDQPQVIYLYQDGDYALTVVLPINYNGEFLGRIAIAILLDTDWLNTQARNPNSHLLLTRGKTILATTSVPLTGKVFKLHNEILKIKGETFRLAKIAMPPGTGDIPNFWLAESEAVLLSSFARYNRIMIGVMLVSSMLILIIAVVAVNRFSRPINRLIKLTREMADGHLPSMDRTEGGTEVDALLNQFVDLTESLREKDKEVTVAHELLRRTAITDELTQLYNRRYLDEIFPKLLAQSQRDNSCVTAILCDLDFFKRINDKFGHAAGDYCLVEFSQLLSRHCRANDYVFRMGGEEFLVLLLTKNSEIGIHLANKICAATREHLFSFNDQTLALTVSCGVSCMLHAAGQKPDHSRLVAQADRALYQAKEAGRDGAKFYQEGPSLEPESVS